MLSRFATALLVLALLGAACSDSPTIVTASSTAPPTTSDPNAAVVFGSGSVPDTVPAEFPIPTDAVIGSTLIDRNRGVTEMVVRVSTETEALTEFFDTNLPNRGFTVLSSAASRDGWKVEFSGDAGTGTIDISDSGRGVAQALVTFSAT